MRGNAEVLAGQRFVRLLFLAGMIIVAYLTLSLFDRAAHADTGVIDQVAKANPVASAKNVVADSIKVSRPVVKVSTPKAASAKAASAETTARAVVSRPSKVLASRTTKVKATSVRQVRPALRSLPPVQLSAQPALSQVKQPALSQVKQPALPRVHLPAQPALPRVELPALPRVELPALPRVDLPVLPRVELPALPWVELPAIPVLPHVPADLVPSGLSVGSALPPQAQPSPFVLTASPMLTSLIGPPAGGFSGPAAAQIDRTAVRGPQPRPAPARPSPTDPQSSTGHARDSGGGNALAMGTVPSSWRPEAVAAGLSTPADLTVHGRTVRYAGPPS